MALLKAATGLSDEELTWRMETSKPAANAYRIASAALDRAETTYERQLWRQVRRRWHYSVECSLFIGSSLRLYLDWN